MNKANKYSLEKAKSLDDLATRICGFGYYANHNDDREHPVPKEAVREYLEVGAAFQRKETEQKLQKLKKLADAMYKEKQLFLVQTRGCGEFYVVAGSYDMAANIVRDELTAQDFGYSCSREVVSVKFLCRQSFFGGKRFLAGDNGENNLFVWGDGNEGK